MFIRLLHFVFSCKKCSFAFTEELIWLDPHPLIYTSLIDGSSVFVCVQAKGADVNGKVFRGYPTTAAAREGRAEVAELLVRAGASQPACEEAIVEAALQGQAALAAIFMCSDLVRPRVAVHALVSAAARGFVDVVDTLVEVQPRFARFLLGLGRH